MKATDIRPAMKRPIGKPLNWSGICEVSRRSRTPAIRVMASRKPSAPNTPLRTAESMSYCALVLSVATPRTAQLVVIRGR